MRRLRLVWSLPGLLGLLGLMASGPAWCLELVTPEEMRASAAAIAIYEAKSVPAPEAPQIELLRPNLLAPVVSPTAIELRFKASPDSQVRPESFRVLYGRLRLDITSRLLQSTRITQQGMHVDQATLPQGSHRLLLSIEDTLGRRGHTQLDFNIQ